MTPRLLLLLAAYFNGNVAGQFYCADEVQKCAVAVEQYEKQIMDMKNMAFRQCFKRPSCNEERNAYNRCFRESLRAVRAPFNGDLDTFDTFAQVSNRYRASLDNCFMHSPVPPRRTEFGPPLVDEDAVYARAIYSTEMTDRLWGLPEITHPQLDTLGVCLVKNFVLRVFGSGIGRSINTFDPRINNITSACTMEEYEIRCYQSSLENNPTYTQLLYNRDYALKSCLQTVRLQTPCRHSDGSRLRACICGVRDDFEREMQQNMLDCVRKQGGSPMLPPFSTNRDPFSKSINSGINTQTLLQNQRLISQQTSLRQATLQTAAIQPDAFHGGVNPRDFQTRISSVGTQRIPIPVPPMDAIEKASIVEGEIVNGKCLCACGSGDTRSVLSRMGVPFRSGGRFFEQPSDILRNEYWRGHPKKDEIPIDMEQNDSHDDTQQKEDTTTEKPSENQEN